MKNHIPKLFFAFVMLALSTINSQFSAVFAQGTTAFTYQGQLRDNGTNANGAYTMILKLYDASSGGTQIGSTITTSPTLLNGLFTVNLDFGVGAFNGSARYLDITVTNGGTTQTLSPRVQVLPSPYAQFAALAATVTNGAITSAQLAANAVGAANIQNGAVMDANIVSVSGAKVTGSVNSAINADFLDGLGSTNFVPADNLTNYVTLDGDQTFSGFDSFDQGISIGDWDVYTDKFDGISDVLTINQNGYTRAIIAPNGGVTGDGTPQGMIVFGQIQGDDIKADDNADVEGLLTANDAYVTGYLTVDANADVGGNLTVDGTIYGNLSGSVIDASVVKANTAGAAPVLKNQDILNRVVQLQISHWHSKNPADAVRHIGPGAKDFNTAFGFGNSTNLISLTDENGVALAAIQALNQKLNEKDAEIKTLQKQMADLKTLVDSQSHKTVGGQP